MPSFIYYFFFFSGVTGLGGTEKMKFDRYQNRVAG